MLRANMLAIFLSLLSCSICAAQCAGPFCPAAVNQAVAGEQIAALPQDQSRLYLTVIGDTDDPEFHRIVAWFEDFEDLRKIKRQVHFHAISTDSTDYKERYAPACRGTPCIWLQEPSGRIVPGCDLVGDEIPMSPQALVRAINIQAAQKFGTHDARGLADVLKRKAPESKPPLPPTPPLDSVITVPGEKPVVLVSEEKQKSAGDAVAMLFQILLMIGTSTFGSGGTTNALLIGYGAFYLIRQYRKAKGLPLLLTDEKVAEIAEKLKPYLGK